jgi:ABC-type oligopeptide transport system substrate-binding subunit
MYRPAVALATAVLLAAALIAVPRARGAAAPTTLTIAVGIDADTLDPEGQTTTTVANMVDYMFDALVWYNDERSGVEPGQAQYTKIVPQLAAGWTASPDGRTYTFRLRHGAVSGRHRVQRAGGEVQRRSAGSTPKSGIPAATTGTRSIPARSRRLTRTPSSSI